MKKLRLKEGLGVPMLITKTVVQREPTAEIKSRFVGLGRGLINLGSNLLSVAKVVLRDSFFEEEVKRDDGGVLERRHFAVNLAEDDKGHFLDVTEISHDVPCGLSFEFIQLAGTRPPRIGQNTQLDSPVPFETQARAIQAAKKRRAEEALRAAAQRDFDSPYYNSDFSEDAPEVQVFDGAIQNGQLLSSAQLEEQPEDTQDMLDPN